MLQSSLGFLRTEKQQYTDQAYDNVRRELKGDLQILRSEMQSLREEVQALKQRELATSHSGDAVIDGVPG